jgi:hypothetical protein
MQRVMVMDSAQGGVSMAILCEDCKNFKTAGDPQVAMAIFGYCREWEYPFLQAIFKPETVDKIPKAFPAPTDCKYYAKGKG